MTPLLRFESWEAFNDDLVGHCRNRHNDVLRGYREMNGDSYRLSQSRRKRKTPPST